MTGILYLSYTGMLEPLGQSQVLAYLERLAPGRVIHLVSFETAENAGRPDKVAAIRARMEAAGIVWHPLRYHKRPSAAATAYDIAQGIAVGTRLVRRHGLSIVHARSYVPSVMALAIKRMTGARYLFDMRGLWADERVDGGIWPRSGRMFRIAKDFERRFLLAADSVVSLTKAAKREIESFPYLAGRAPPVTVIPTCADLERFSPGSGKAGAPITLGYVGTIGRWYDFEKSAVFFRHLRARRPDARMLILNRGEHDRIASTLNGAGLAPGDYEIREVGHDQVPGMIRRMHAGIVIARPAYSHIARAPTKLAEFLGCGVPCLANAGIGDMGPIISDNRAGVVMEAFSPQAYDAAVAALLDLLDDDSLSPRCVATARSHFSLDEGVTAYGRIYDLLANSRPPAAGIGTLDH